MDKQPIKEYFCPSPAMEFFFLLSNMHRRKEEGKIICTTKEYRIVDIAVKHIINIQIMSDRETLTVCTTMCVMNLNNGKMDSK